jgi:hypothetical protein
VPTEGKTGFSLLSPATTGISFSNHLSDAAAAANRILENGSGVALGDVDGDGWCDVYFCRLGGPNALYRNLGTGSSRMLQRRRGGCANQNSTGAVFADVDGDGDPDLLVNAIAGGTRLFFNDGKGQFAEAKNSGLDRTLGSTSLALADADGDGDLDLYVANYRTTTLKDNPPGVKPDARRVGDKIVVTPEDRFMALTAKEGGVMIVERGEPDAFYLNDGKGKFTAVSWTGGTFLDATARRSRTLRGSGGFRWCSAISKGMARPISTCATTFFYSTDQFWLNDGRGKFRACSARCVARNEHVVEWRQTSPTSIAMGTMTFLWRTC